MAQDRMLRAELRTSEKVNEWPIPVRFFWTQLWGYCDDWGRGRYDARLIKADAFPLDDEVTAVQVGRWMVALETAGVIAAYEVDGKRYFECLNWFEHQDVSYLRKSSVPDRAGVIPTPRKNSKAFQKVPEDSRPREGKGREVEVEEKGESADGAPAPFCKKHPTGTDDPCRACGNARRARDAWEAEEKAKPSVRPSKSGECVHRFVGGYCAECSIRQEAA